MSMPSDFAERSQAQETVARDRGPDDRLSRLDQLEREIAEERARLTRTDREADQRDARREDPRQDSRDDRSGSYARVDLPELEERVTESQREAWALGYQAGVADSQSRTGDRSVNPFHPLRG